MSADSVEGVESILDDPELRDFRCLVLDARSGQTLLSQKADEPSPCASVMKLITGASAFVTLEPDGHGGTTQQDQPWRFHTRTYASHNTVTVVGAGDVTMTRCPTGAPTFYPAGAHLDVFADQIATSAVGEPRAGGEPQERPVRLVLNAGLYRESEWHPTWEPEGRHPDNYIPFITALMVDGDRNDPVEDDSPRTDDPVARFGDELARHLSARLGTFVAWERADGTGPDGTLVATAESAPLEALITEMERSSDNALAESLARQVALSLGYDASWDGVSRAAEHVMAGLGLPVDGCTFVDGSGLSVDNRLTARLVAELLLMMYRDERGLRRLLDRLTQTGPDGTFSSKRFAQTRELIGDAVRAKTGYIQSVHSMAGVVTTRGGRDLVFAAFAVDHHVEDATREALDRFVTALHVHGDELPALTVANEGQALGSNHRD